ncbi:MAG: hypothetical protein IJ870_06780, partial [Alphaproteobacteria bacterium]|nr:hypothetical protein [Alphaproteobacteria bacterium]
CASIGASSSSSGSIIAPNASKCTKTYSDCGTSCSSLGGQSNKPGEGYKYDTITVNSQPCHYNLTPKSCSEAAGSSYPNSNPPSCGTYQDYNTSNLVYIGPAQQYCFSNCFSTCFDSCGAGDFSAFPYSSESDASADGGYQTDKKLKCDNNYCYKRGNPFTCSDKTNGAFPYDSKPFCTSISASVSSTSLYQIGETEQFCYSDCQCNTSLGYYDSASKALPCGCGETIAGTTISGLTCYSCVAITCSNGVPHGTNYIGTDGVNYGPLTYWTATNLKAN